MPKGFRVLLNGGVSLSGPPSELKPGELAFARNSLYLPEGQDLTKWPGNTLFGAAGLTLTGLDFVKFRNGDSFLIASGGTFYASAPAGTTGSWTSRAAGLSAVGPMEAVYYNGTDRAYIADGVNPLKVWPGSGNMRTAGLTRPAAGTISFLGNSGTTYPNGTTFQYTHAEYDSTNDVESAPAPVVSAAATAANGTFKYHLPADTNGSNFDKIRLYRTQHGGDVFFRVAEFTKVSRFYYDGTNSDAGSPATVNNDIYGFVTLDDIYLSQKPVMPMTGQPIRGNYITVNGTIPIGEIIGIFQESFYIAGIAGFGQDLHFSMPRFPETFPPGNFVTMENERGDPITGAGVANDRLIIFTTNSIFRMNALPLPTDPPGAVTREEVTKDHGCVAKRTVVNFGVGQPNNRLFYLSTRGPMMTDGYTTTPLNEDLNWDASLVNMQAMSGCVAKNFPKYQVIVLFAPSASSTTNDIAFVYHYHPAHVKESGIGKWLAPLHKRCADAAVTYDVDTETRLFIADTTSDGNVYLEDSGVSDAQFYDDSSGKILWEWMTGDNPFDEESANKRVQRTFLNMIGTDDTFNPIFSYAVNKADTEHGIFLSRVSQNQASLLTFGTSLVTAIKSRSYVGGVWQTGTHFRWHLKELAAADRAVVSHEVEIEPFGRQR